MRQIAALAITVFLASSAQHAYGGQKEWMIPDSMLNDAKTSAGISSGTTVYQKRSKKRAYGAASVDINGGRWIAINPWVFENLHPDILISSAYGVGLLTVTLLHENLHHCLGIPPKNDPRRNRNSCEHLAIDAGAASAACGMIPGLQECVASGGDNAQECEDKIQGLCDGISNLQDNWDSPAEKDHASDCCNGDQEPGFTPDPSCPGAAIPGADQDPPDCDYSDQESAIPDCDQCPAEDE